MDLIGIRRRMLMEQKSGELYPVGTNILSFYQVYGTEEGNSNFNTLTGDVIYDSRANVAVSAVYIPVTSEYTYHKTSRFYRIAFYDEHKNFISSTNAYNNTTADVQVNVPQNAKYLRICIVLGARPSITRTA